MEVSLAMNGMEISADVNEQEKIILAVASGSLTREELIAWLQQYTVKLRI